MLDITIKPHINLPDVTFVWRWMKILRFGWKFQRWKRAMGHRKGSGLIDTHPFSTGLMGISHYIIILTP